MKKFWSEFFKRGALAAASGPIIVCIVWACLKAAGVIEALDVNTVNLAILSSMVMAFVAAGISVLYQMEQLPKIMAALIQMAVLYADYLLVYLINGWLPINAIGIFTAIFVACFAIIWAIIYFSVTKSVKKLNAHLNNDKM